MLTGLGFSKEDYERPADTFSGGWQMRIALAKLLLGRPGLLLLDEPTNHLDLDARNWLESYLRDYPHAVILVSHDRFFLDAVVTKIADLNLRTMTDYHGNYSDYLVERDARLERLRAAKKEQDDEVARSRCSSIASAIRRPRPRRCRAGSSRSTRSCPSRCPGAQARALHVSGRAKERADGAGTDARPEGVRAAHRLRQPVAAHRARRSDCACRPKRRRQVDLMRMLSGEEAPDRENGTWATRSCQSTSRRTRRRPRPGADRLRDALERRADAHGAGNPEHPGRLPVFWRRRVQEGRCAVWRRAHAARRRAHAPAAVQLLLLDEPTNHLDLDSKDVLLDALADYGGTLIFVSHDATPLSGWRHGSSRLAMGAPSRSLGPIRSSCGERSMCRPPAPQRPITKARRHEGTKPVGAQCAAAPEPAVPGERAPRRGPAGCRTERPAGVPSAAAPRADRKAVLPNSASAKPARRDRPAWPTSKHASPRTKMRSRRSKPRCRRRGFTSGATRHRPSSPAIRPSCGKSAS